MFDHILVPIRLGKPDTPLIAPAIGLAKLSQAEVTLLHVVERISGLPLASLKSFHKRMVGKAQRALDRVLKSVSKEGIPVASAVLVGDPAAEIVRFASTHGVDLIVMGSHSVRSDEAGSGLATTSYKVGFLCRCPVFLVKDLKPASRSRR